MIGLLLLPDGFEDSEALTTRDLLIRAGIEIKTLSLKNDERIVNSSHNLTLFSDLTPSNLNKEEFDFLILPGGLKGVNNMKESSFVNNLVLDFSNKNKLICAICAAPGVIGKLGLLKNKNYTCYPNTYKGEGNNTNKEVEIDNNLITARSMYYSVDFALAIIETLLGKEKREEILKQIQGR